MVVLSHILWLYCLNHSMNVKIMEEISNMLSFMRYLHIVPGYSAKHQSSQALWTLEALSGE